MTPHHATSSSRHRASRRHAFTLVELLVVVGIIAILAAALVPAVRSLGRDNDRSQAMNHIKALLAQARSLAVAQHRQAGVVFFQESAKYSMPVHAGQTAMQIFIEDYDQTRLTHSPKNTIFVAWSPARAYLPKGVGIAVLNDDINRGVTTGDETSSASSTRAVLFDAEGRMITRHGLARENVNYGGTPGTYPFAQGDWNFASQGTAKSDTSSNGVSSPGLIVYAVEDYNAANIPTGSDGNAIRNDWIKQHATVMTVNANTGSIAACND